MPVAPGFLFGGVTAFMKIARLAEAFNLPVTSHGAHDVTVHLLAACPNRSYLEAHGFGLDRYIAHPLARRGHGAGARAVRPWRYLRLGRVVTAGGMTKASSAESPSRHSCMSRPASGASRLSAVAHERLTGRRMRR